MGGIGANMLTETQKRIHDNCVEASLNGDDFVFTGYAGTGKTTTLIEVVKTLRNAGKRLAVCTPTGKAAHVLNRKQSVFRAKTLHSVLTSASVDTLSGIYGRLADLDAIASTAEGLSDKEKEEEQNLLRRIDATSGGSKSSLIFTPIDAEVFGDEYDGLVVDEASMLGAGTYDLLVDHLPGFRIYAGDNAQLPPVKDVAAINLDQANGKLTKILRQGEGSGILSLAECFTPTGRMKPFNTLKDLRDVTLRAGTSIASIRGFETTHQAIVWKNKERHALNKVIREARGVVSFMDKYPFLPGVDEPLMVDENAETMGLLKGQCLLFKDVVAYSPGLNPFLLSGKFEDERGNVRTVVVNLEDCCESYPLNLDDRTYKRCVAIARHRGIKMAFPHALTAHKSQGSEWDKVFIMCSMSSTRPEYKQWLYTAITRAAKEVVLTMRWGHV